MQSWDDLRYFLALYRCQKLTAAGRFLNVNHTTVGRRIKELEVTLDAKLFQKNKNGFEPTKAGFNLVEYAETIEKTVMGIERIAGAESKSIKGLVRICSPEDFGVYFLATRLPTLLKEHDGLEIDLLYSHQRKDCSQYEVDISITTERPVNGRVVVKRLADYTMGLFASKKYFEKNSGIRSTNDLRHHLLIGSDDDLAMSRLLQDTPLSDCQKLSFRSHNLTAQYKAIQNGGGLCVLPCFLKHEYDDLQQVLAQEIKIKRTLWLVVNEDMRHVNRIKKTMDFIADTVFSNQSLLFT